MNNDSLLALKKKALSVLIPPPRLTLSDWIENNVYLPEDVSSMPGTVRLWTFQREIADAIGDTKIERVTLVKPVRVGFTTLLTGAVAGYIANDPAPILCLLPTEADCRDYMVSDIEPIFNASPKLMHLIGDEKDESGRNTILSRRFPGGSLKVVAAKAPRNLRRHNVRILLCDEVDGMENGSEGSPILLAEKRTLSFADRKIVIGSTPVFEDTSQVLRSYAQSDARVFEVPCPECGVFHEITWKDIQWPEGKPEQAFYTCPTCGSVIEERHKPDMVAKGRWRKTNPDIKNHAGFRLNALISLLPNASWGKLAAEYLSAKDDPARLQTFINTILGQGWRENGQELDDAQLSEKREAFSLNNLPEAVLAITAGVDVQRDRLEATIIGWDRKGNAYILSHNIFWGLPEHSDTWAEIDKFLKGRFKHPLGGTLGIDAVAIDSGDGETMQHVYSFCFPRASRKVMAIKGVAGNRPWIEKSRSKIKGGWLWIVGVEGIKSHLMSRLSRGHSIRFCDDLPNVWFEQLASERIVLRYSRGQPVRRFERIPGRRAEALDCVVYAFAAKQVININFDERLDEMQRGIVDKSKEIKAVVKSKWLK